MIPNRPLGAGVGAGSLSALKFGAEPHLAVSDNFVLVLALACGIPGALLFGWILASEFARLSRNAARAAGN